MRRRLVFPAHAGMSRRVRLTPFSHARFPRTRGDEPFALDGRGDTYLFSPHTRG